MKQINVWFDDKEHKEITDKKDELGLNWHDFILELVKSYSPAKISSQKRK